MGIPRSRGLVAAVSALVLPAAVAVASAAPARAAAPVTRYAALGDSYTSAPFTGNFAGTPLGCARSDNNYPHVVQGSVHAASFTDVSCGGATTSDFAGAQGVDPDGPNPPQYNALSSATDLVTVGIGGNDIGFTSIIKACVTYSPFGTPCKDKFVRGGVDELAGRIAATAPKIAAVLAAVHAKSPNARVLLVGYPAILPESGGCWPTVPITSGDVTYLRGVEKGLNAMLAAQAGAGGARYVDTYTPSIGHDVCKGSSTRWVEGIIPGNAAFPMHPNATGEAHMAAAVLAAVDAG